MKVGVVILSRLNSSRLPGKALLQINGKSVLDYIIERVTTVFDLEDVIIATSYLSSDDQLSSYCQQKGLKCFRGSLDNVAERFYNAANEKQWDYAIRINGDNIFVDCDLLHEMSSLAQLNKYNFISNVKGRTFPKGMSIEIVRLSYYKLLLPQINKSEQYKEHVTLYLYEHDNDSHHYVYNDQLKEAAGIQMALDTPEDFEKIEKIVAQFESPQHHYNLREIFSILRTIENAKPV